MALIEKGLGMALGRLPKVITPARHARLDYLAAGIFLAAGAALWRRHRRASSAALFCGGAMAATSLATDYTGNSTRPIDFETHGRIHVGLAALTAALPRVMGFDDEPQSRLFGLMALGSTAAASLTDFGRERLPAGFKPLRRAA